MRETSRPQRIAILSTGLTEWYGLADALGTLFEGHYFFAVPTPDEVTSYREKFPYPGFTSNPLNQKNVQQPPEEASELVERAAQEALGDRKANKPPADLVVIIDDLELANRSQAPLVVEVLRSAIRRHLAELNMSVAERTAEALRNKVSFHLLVPMVEAWFFADQGALRNAGVPADRQVAFTVAQDPEQFCTDDPGYLSATAADCPKLAALPGSKQKKLRPKWLGTGPRDLHPKGYVQWLCIDSSETNCTMYQEKTSGAEALRKIDWLSVLGRPPMQLAHMAALLDDIADALTVSLPLLVGRTLAPVTSRSCRPQNAVLRNI